MSSEAPILYNQLKKEFRQAMIVAKPESYVERPKSLSRLSGERKAYIEDAKRRNQETREVLLDKTRTLMEEYDLDSLTAMDLILQGRDTQNRLLQEGSVFGGKAFNFALNRFEMTEKEEKKTVQVCENAMAALTILGKGNLAVDCPLNSVEKSFEELSLLPNASRIDLLLTPSGPQIIEINSQWVDAIAALAGFLSISGQNPKALKLIESFTLGFRQNSRLAILDIPQGKGSRETGASLELQRLAERLQATRRFKICEVLDPEKINLKYLSSFDSFYINCDPKYFSLDQPDWIRTILDKVTRNKEAMFPAWRPILDKKIILARLTNPDSQLTRMLAESGVDVELLKQSIVPTLPLSEWRPDGGQDYVIKGDGYSLNAVAVSTSSEFPDYLKYALGETDSYVVQPFIEGKRMNTWVFDTSSQKVVFLPNAFTKLNIWTLKGKVVGMLATASPSPLISDKGYNSIPLIRKLEKNEK